MTSKVQKILIVVPILTILALWEVVSRTSVVNPALFPPASQVASAFGNMITSGTLSSDLSASVWRLLAGLCVGSVIGILLGLLTGRIRSLAHALAPIIHILRSIPPVAIIPLVIVWFGIGDGAKIFSIAFAVFFPVWINTHVGAEQVQRVFLWKAKLAGLGTLATIRTIALPSATPFIITGIRNGIALAFIMIFVSELAGASSGLGYRISITQLAYRIDEMIAALIVLGALGALTDQLFVFGTRKIFPWLALS
ncbi:MAG: ABC transporter permease [Patescibacteria group bacterium]